MKRQDLMEKYRELLMSIKEKIIVSQSAYSKLSFVTYDWKLSPEEANDHFGIVGLYNNRSITFHDLYDNKLIAIAHTVPHDHINSGRDEKW